MNEESGNVVDLISGTVVGTAVNAPGSGLGTDPVSAYGGAANPFGRARLGSAGQNQFSITGNPTLGFQVRITG